jgi:uncharacterized phiE125 gp8 family phage protein
MNIELITPPTIEPVTVAEAFFHLKLSADPTADVSAEPQYAEVERFITAAREDCERRTRRAFVQQTLKLTMGPPRREGERRGWDWFIAGGACAWGDIELLRPPLISVTAVRYYDESNQLQTVDEASYFVESGLVSAVRFISSFEAPPTYIRKDAIQVEYVAGYAPVGEDLATNVPAAIKSAILLGVQLQFDKLMPNERAAIENSRDALLGGFEIKTF